MRAAREDVLPGPSDCAFYRSTSPVQTGSRAPWRRPDRSTSWSITPASAYQTRLKACRWTRSVRCTTQKLPKFSGHAYYEPKRECDPNACIGKQLDAITESRADGLRKISPAQG